MHEGSATYAKEISDKLKELVFREVMPEIAGGFVAYRHRQLGIQAESEESLRQIYQASLSLLYKLLFVLYAEARSLLPIANPAYWEESLTRMAQGFAEQLDRGPGRSATPPTPPAATTRCWPSSGASTRATPAWASPATTAASSTAASPDNQFLAQHKLSDRAVARAVDILVRDAGQPVDYAYISVRNLGSIYEGLLENKLHVVDAEVGIVELVNDKGERKATGSYYTPDYIVTYIVEQTLTPILDERQSALRRPWRASPSCAASSSARTSAGAAALLRQQLEPRRARSA